LLGDSSLHHASRKSIDIVKFLIGNGGNVNLCNKNGDTPFITAVKKAKYDIAYEILKCKDFKTNLKN